MRRSMAALALAALLTGGVADARPRGWHGRHHGGGGGGTAAALVGGALIGALIAVAAGSAGRGGEERVRAPSPEEDAAADRCAAEAAREGQGRVLAVDQVDRFADGWRVIGVVEGGAASDGGAPPAADSFTCTIVGERVAVRLARAG